MKPSFIPAWRQSAALVNPGGYAPWCLRRFAPMLIPLLALTLLLTVLSRPVIAAAQSAGEPAAASVLQSRDTLSNTGTLGQIYLPVLLRPAQGQEAAAPTATPTPVPPTATPAPVSPAEPPREWDPRLDARGATLREANAAPGQGYWRLVRAVWYDEQQSQGRHHIFLDAIDQNGNRIVGLPIKVYWNGGSATVTTQAKPGEPYAADFGMFALAPAYGATPADANPADDVWGMGLGSVEQPNYAIHTSYGLVWQWTVKPNQEPEPTTTPTPIPEPTATPTDSPGATPTATATATPTATPVTPTPTATPGSSYLFSRAELVRCDPNGGNTYVQGTVRLDGQPANGYRVVFSWAPDGPIVAGITSGPHDGYPGWNPGYYSHILQAGGPRQGDWWFWIVDAWNVRISEMAYVHTDGAVHASSCQQAVIDFDSR